jgi:hypothetical protein
MSKLSKPVKKPPRTGNDFSGQNLAGRDFSNMVLIGANFSNSNCSNCDFSGSDLSFANFDKANLYRSVFSRAIVYVTYFVECDLTRANFDRAFIYGVKFAGNVNVTYTNFSNLQLESFRRCTVFPKDKTEYSEVLFGKSTADNTVSFSKDYSYKKIYGSKFTCGEYYMEFRDYKKYEREMQLSQIYNRLKRIFKENDFFNEAGQFYYHEKYWQTRSWYAQETEEDFTFQLSLKRIAQTVVSRINETIIGYGERPSRVIWWIVGGILAFAGAYYAGSFLGFCKATQSAIYRFGMSLYFSVCSLTSLGSNDLTPVGFGKSLTALESVYGAIMITLLGATIIRKLIRD